MERADPTPSDSTPEPSGHVPARVVLDGLAPRRTLGRRLLRWVLFVLVGVWNAVAAVGAV
jgi:hypothetical protein